MADAREPHDDDETTKNQEHDELARLVGTTVASVQDSSAYEQQVIQTARRSLAPKLDVSTLGLPENWSSELQCEDPHVLSKVLHKLRQQQEPPYLSDKTALQIQLLLLQLGKHNNNDFLNDVLSLQVERRDEQVRSQKLIADKQQQQQQQKVVQFDTAAPTKHAAATNQKRPPRVPIMQRRQQQQQQDDNDHTDTNHVAVPKIDVQALKALREARVQRKRRFQARFPNDNACSSSSSEEQELDDTSDAGVTTLPTDNNSNNDSDDPPTTAQTNSVVCPVCNVDIFVDREGKSSSNNDSNTNVDHALAVHMSQCQSQPQATHRARRSTRASNRTATLLPVRKQKRMRTTASALSQKQPRRKYSQSTPSASFSNTYTSSEVDDGDEFIYEDRVDDWISHGLEHMKVMPERDDSEALPGATTLSNGLFVPAWMHDRLFSYQRQGLSWMWDIHEQLVGGIVGDEMGLGKTVQVSSFLGACAGSRKLRSVLLIVPATMLQHWLNELAIWAPGLRRILIHGERSISHQLLRKLSKWLKEARATRLYEAIDDKDWDEMPPHSFCGTGFVVLTTYENVRRNADIYIAHKWSYLVLDEAQKIRNPDAEITLTCKRIRTPHRLALSGTPIQNDLRELWSLFDFVFPGRLGTLPAFEQEFAVPIKRGGYSNASPMQVQLAYRCAVTLRDLIEPFMLRRLKKDVKEVSRMPGKTEHVLFCRLSTTQRSMYEAYLQSDDVARVMRGSANLLAAVTMLRKIANHPDLVCDPSAAALDSFIQNRGLATSNLLGDDSDEEDVLFDEESMVQRSGKLEVLAKILPLWRKQGHRVLIFCQWKKMLNIIQSFTMMKGWKFGRLDGNTNVAARQRLVDTFNSDDSYMGLLCTTKTGGVGLNLTGANRIVLYDPDWNPQSDAQARERAWRFGQKRSVTIYRLIVAGTIEEKIYQRQIFKTALSNKVLQDPKQRRLFSQRDLRDLFTLSADTGSVRSGGDGVTETVKVTKGDGVIDAVDDVNADGPNDNEATLQTVMRSKGLAGIFDHHAVEPNLSRRKSTTVREMEAEAKRVARDAVEALKRSVPDNETAGIPTWTGSEETKPQGLFGSSSTMTNGASKRNSGPLTSGGLLASIRKQNEAIQSDGIKKAKLSESTKQYTAQLQKLRTFVVRFSPSTNDILQEFESTPDADMAIFRRLLKSVAVMQEDGRWYLKK